MVEHKSNRVAQDLPKQPGGQVPEVLGPYPLYGETLGELGENGIYPVAESAQQGAPLRGRISLLGGEGGQKFDAHRAEEFFFGPGRVVVAVPDHHPAHAFDDLGHHRELVGVGRGHRDASNETRPADPNVYPKAVEGLLE